MEARRGVLQAVDEAGKHLPSKLALPKGGPETHFLTVAKSRRRGLQPFLRRFFSCVLH